MRTIIHAIKTEWELVTRGKTRRELLGDVACVVFMALGAYLTFLLS